MRNTWTGILGASAECLTCGWGVGSRNSLGLAAQHHDRTGHDVRIEQVLGVSYLSDASHAARRAEKAAQSPAGAGRAMRGEE